MRTNTLSLAVACALAAAGFALVPTAAPAADAPSTSPQPQQAAAASNEPSQAQTTDAQPPAQAATSQPSQTLPTVIVTATRRAEREDTVPVAMTAISGQQLQESGVVDTQNLQMVSPELNVYSSTSESQGAVIRLRGVGTAGQNPGFEGSVGVFVDGVYRANSGLALQDLYDIKQVEVLRGPQSTLFGKNTSAGVINILTNEPTFTPEANVDVKLGNHASRQFTGVVSGPVTKTLALRVAANYDRADGVYDDIVTGTSYNDRNRWSVRAQALWKPTDDFSLRVIADSTRKRENCCAFPFVVYGDKAAKVEQLGGYLAPIGTRKVAVDAPIEADLTMSGLSAEANWNLHWATFKALLSDRHSQSLQAGDGDRTDLSILINPGRTQNYRTRTADFSLQGNSGRLDWLAGYYYEWGTVDSLNPSVFGPDANSYILATPRPFYPAGTGNLDHSHQNSHSNSLYTHDIIHLDHGFDVTLGLRHVWENKHGFGDSTSDVPSCLNPKVPAAAKFLCAVPPYDANFDDNRTVGTAALSKSIGQGIAYVSYTTGYKAGGINLNPTEGAVEQPTFKPETTKDYEAGIKQRIGQRFKVAADVYVGNYSDFQLLTFNGTNLVVSNAASITTKGLELQGIWSIARGYRLQVGYSYNKATYGRDSANGKGGQTLPNAPHSTLSASLDMRRPIGANVLFANLTGRFQSATDLASTATPATRSGGYTLFNARVGMRFSNEFSVALWARNLTNKFYYTNIFATTNQPGSFNGVVGQSRAVGVEVRKDFF